MQNSGSASCARPITTISALSLSNISSARTGSFILPTATVISPVSFLILAAFSTLNPLSKSTGGTSNFIAALEKLPRDTSTTSTPASLAILQNSIVSSIASPPSK
ncbi:hypothetical protein D3C75_1191060 [compost metagenome]